MLRATRFVLGFVAASAVTALAPAAWAEPPGPRAMPIHVLTISTDDADDQADALTQALRARVRQAQGWSLLETNQSFDMLAIALKCPPRPDAGCLQRIGDQIHGDRFIWGTMAKKRGGEVATVVHLWTRGKGDTDVAEAYSDNLKDPSDEALRSVAAKIFAKLTGGVSGGTLVVHAGSGGGAVLVDGSEKATLEHGVARVDVPVGSHQVAVRVAGYEAPSQSASVPAGGERDLSFSLAPSAASPEGAAAHSAFPTRKVLAYSAIVVGGGLLVASAIETAAWFNDQNASNADRTNVPTTVTDVCQDQVNASAQDACRRSKDAVTVSTLAWIFGGVGLALVGTGTLLVVTDHPSTEAPAEGASRRSKPRFDVLPSIGTRGASLDLHVTF